MSPKELAEVFKAVRKARCELARQRRIAHGQRIILRKAITKRPYGATRLDQATTILTAAERLASAELHIVDLLPKAGFGTTVESEHLAAA
jgi:hypothetical protein